MRDETTSDGPRPADITLGPFAAGHLGDAMCATPLPRLLAARGGVRVWVADLPVLRAVFANNPYVSGFTAGPGGNLDPRVKGFGHLTQRFQQGFGLRPEPDARPELYLNPAEQDWAAEQRSRWPRGRPACILSTRVISDAAHFRGVDWVALGRALARRFTVVQPVLTAGGVYRRQVDPREGVRAGGWRAEPRVPGAVVYEDLPLRRFLALFAVADAFCGGTSGGAHAAAAFGVPNPHRRLAGLAAGHPVPRLGPDRLGPPVPVPPAPVRPGRGPGDPVIRPRRGRRSRRRVGRRRVGRRRPARPRRAGGGGPAVPPEIADPVSPRAERADRRRPVCRPRRRAARTARAHGRPHRMNELAHLAAFLLTAVGLTVLLVWPDGGPGAWVRERLLRRILPARAAGALDCYVCCGFWCGAALSPAWWWLLNYHEPWCWLGGPMTAAVFWLVLRPGTDKPAE